MIISGLTVLSLLFIQSVASKCPDKGQTHLWKLTKTGRQNPVYLFGTIHVSWTQVWHHLHPNIHSAFDSSNLLMLELALNNDTVIDELNKCRHLPSGTRLEKIIGKHLFLKIEKYVASRKRQLIGSFFDLQAKNQEQIKSFHEITHLWHRKKPTWVLFMLFHLLQFDENQVSVKKPAPMLDVFLANEAQRLNKQVESIESAREQCEPLFSMSNHQVTLAIEETLAHLIHKKDKTTATNLKNESILSSYLCGGLDETIFDSTEFLDVVDRQHNDLGNIQTQIHQDMIIKRNERMALRLNQVFQKNHKDIIFVAIGAAHFIGDADVISRLKRLDDYSIVPVRNDEILEQNYIRLGSNPLRSFKSFRNLWERDSSTKASSKSADFVIWQEEYPREIFDKNGSHPTPFPAIIVVYWLFYFVL